MKNVNLLIYTLVFLGILPACHRARYTTLKPIENRQQCKNHKGFEVVVKALTVAETKDLFGANLISKGYQPLQVEMCNNSHETYAISGNYVELPLAPSYMITNNVHYDTFNISWTSGLLSAIFCFPLIPVVVYSSYKMHDYNKAIDTKIRDITLNSEELISIHPGECIMKIVFIQGASRNTSRFTLGFLNTKTQEVVKMNFNAY